MIQEDKQVFVAPCNPGILTEQGGKYMPSSELVKTIVY